VLADVKKIKDIKSFQKYPTYFGEEYEALRLPDREIALERWGKKIRVCLCQPYQIEKDIKSKVVGRGAGEVLMEWVVTSEEEAVEIINDLCLEPIRLDRINLYYE